MPEEQQAGPEGERLRSVGRTTGAKAKFALFDSDGFATLAEIQRAAYERLTPEVWNFIEGGAGDEWTLADNREAFKRWQFLPRNQSGVSPPDASTTLLGISLPFPLITAPFGMDALYHPEGLLALARAHARSGVPFTVSFGASCSLEEVAAAAPTCPKFFNIAPNGSEQRFIDLAKRAEDAGYLALVVTVDGPVSGWRERSLEDRFSPDISTISGHFRLPSGDIDIEAVSRIGQFESRQWTWAQLGDVCSRTQIPFIVKGVLTGADARLAIDAGTKAIWISNHGGRQLDSAPSTLEQLPEIAAEVGGLVEIIIDGGIRRGSDILKTLALGATVAAIGRPAAYGLAAAGEQGVLRVLELLHQELLVTMTLTGRDTISAIDTSLVRSSR